MPLDLAYSWARGNNSALLIMASENYSAKVELTLAVGGETLSLSHVGPSGIVVRGDCRPMPPGSAEIHIKVDDTESIRKVFLPFGIPGPRQPIAFV